MIPIRLAVRNFMSYTDIHEPLTFEGIHVACLSGENGAGKSTLLDAVTWALWGYSRAGAGSAQQLIHTGRTDMEVDFEFMLAGETYRVIRKWTAPRRSGSGTTLLELSVKDGDRFRSISGNTVRETDAKITDLLRMSYTTFTNSSFILQNRADAFTTRTPSERKQVLADILELAEYDRLQQRARDEASQREQRRQSIEERLREADSQLQERKAYETDRDRLESEIASLDERLVRDDAEARRLREDLTRLESRERELGEAEQRAQQTQTEVERQRKLIDEHRRALETARRTLANADTIERGAADLAKARAADASFSEKLQVYVRLCDDRNKLNQVVTTARTRLEGELRNVRQHLARQGADAAHLAEHERAVVTAQAEQQALIRVQAEQDEHERQQAATREQAAELRGANVGLRKEMQELKAKIETIQSEPICPICRSQLDPPARQRLTDEYTAEGKAQRARYDENQTRARQLDGQIAQLEAEVKRLSNEASELAGVERRLATAEHAVEAARAATREAEAASLEAARLERQLEQRVYAEAEAARLAETQQQLDALGYDEATHRRVREELRNLAEYDALARELAAARQTVAFREEALEQAQTSLRSWQTRLEDERTRCAELREQVQALPALRQREATAQHALVDLRRQHSEATQALGAVRQRLSFLEHLEQARAERLRELDDVLRDKGLYTDLATAFGKNGVQAMLIETAIPDIQDEANRLLGQMTDGRMHVELKTQRDRRTGEGQIETLDIVINDQLGSRSYEMYSGGEAFRVNFAIRIALSRLLAQRAGARLQTLVIDEGFGSQDLEGRERLVEAIKSVQDEFAMILVITHLEDLKERFPVRIDVRKTALGSVISTDWVA
jgi:exonuclease SbcC